MDKFILLILKFFVLNNYLHIVYIENGRTDSYRNSSRARARD